MSTDECLLNIVGFFRELPPCLIDNGHEHTESRSSLYLSELKGMDLASFDTAYDCEGLIELMENVRLNAIQSLKSDLAVEMGKYVVRRYDSWSGEIGKSNFAGVVPEGKSFKGIKLFSNVRGGTMAIDGFTLMLSETEEVTLSIYKVEDNVFEELEQITVFSEKNKAVKYFLPEKIELDLNGEYYLVYESASNPLKTKFGCCGFSQRYSNRAPHFGNSKSEGWSRWLVASGVSGDGIDSLRERNNPMGLSLSATLTCNGLSILCNEAMDFANDVVPLSIAHALRYKMGEFLLDAIADRGAVNRYTLLTIETLNANRAYYLERYAGILEYVAQELNYFDTDCWNCKDRLVRRGQFL